MRYRRLLGFVTALLSAAVGAAVRADVVVLDVIVDPDGPGTWEVRARLEGDDGGPPTSAGISDFMIDVFGREGVTVTSSANRTPASAYVHPTLGILTAGFAEIRSNGDNGLGILAGQRSVYGAEHDASQDAAVFQGVGIAPGAYTAGLIDVEWDYPLLLASGTYAGRASLGHLYVDSSPAGILLLDDVGSGVGYGWRGPTNLSRPSNVIDDGERVPEPGALLLLGSGAVWPLGRGRRARRRGPRPRAAQ